MDIRKVKKLIDLVKQEGVYEIEIREGEESVRVRQYGDVNKMSEIGLYQKGTAISPKQEIVSVGENSSEEETLQHVVKSPMVGTFYASASPDAPPFVQVGQHVKRGEVLCIIEAMKMFNQIESDRTGKILNCLVQNGQPVEYGQSLFIIE